MLRNGFDVSRNPILKPLDNIECRDALLNEDGTEAEWPKADAIVGNPPFLGGKLLRTSFGSKYVDNLFSVFSSRVPPEADFVAYWFVKGWEAIADNGKGRAGFVATNSMRGGANRKTLEPIVADGIIFDAWSDEPWVLNGAAVRVSLICFAAVPPSGGVHLEGLPALHVNSDLTGGPSDFTTATYLRENAGVAFMGDTKGGPFDISGEVARQWLLLPLNPNGRPNSDVLRPWMNGMDVTRRSADKWIVDFGWQIDEAQAALYQDPFAHVVKQVKPFRQGNRREQYRRYWWRHVEPRPKMWAALHALPLTRTKSPQARFLATARVAKYRIFVWLNVSVVPDSRLYAFAREDDFFFGILQSRIHNDWSLVTCSWHGVGNDPTYNTETCFETFPFPEGLTPNIPASAYADDPRAIRIAAAAKRLDDLREAWLNPADLVTRVPEVVPGYPDRILPVDDKAAAILKKRTLTNLYNERPTWLANAHRDLDRAVAAAYGWPEDIGEEDALARLLALNLERAAAGR